MTELKYKTLDEKKDQCREIVTDLRKGLLCYPMKNCFKLFYKQIYEDFIFLGIKLACVSGDMSLMLNGLFQGNRIGMIQSNWLHTPQDQSAGLINIILAFAANDLKLIDKSMPVSLEISDNGFYKSQYNMIYALYWKNQEIGKVAEKQLLDFLSKKQSKFDISFTLYLLALYHENPIDISSYLFELCNTVTKSNWVQEEIFLDTIHNRLGRSVALFVHGLYHLAYYSLNENVFWEIQIPEHKTFIKEYEKFNIENGFPVGKYLIHFNKLSRYMEHFIDIDIIPEVTTIIDPSDGKKYLDVDSFQKKTFINLKNNDLIKYKEESGEYVFQSLS